MTNSDHTAIHFLGIVYFNLKKKKLASDTIVPGIPKQRTSLRSAESNLIDSRHPYVKQLAGITGLNMYCSKNINSKESLINDTHNNSFLTESITESSIFLICLDSCSPSLLPDVDVCIF